MQRNILVYVGVVLIFCIFSGVSCNKYPFKVDWKNAKGYVIGKETCNADELKDFWLIDFTFGTYNPQVGDTLVMNGVTYTNVLKTSGLDQRLKEIGMRVSIDYKVISATKVVTSGCTVSIPVTYDLKELTILTQGEIR